MLLQQVDLTQLNSAIPGTRAPSIQLSLPRAARSSITSKAATAVALSVRRTTASVSKQESLAHHFASASIARTRATRLQPITGVWARDRL